MTRSWVPGSPSSGSFAALESIAAIGHATWDAIHYVRDKVVSRSLTEFCFVLDLGLCVALLLTTWNLLPV